MLVTLQKEFAKYRKTCPVTKIENKSVTFLRDEKYLEYLKNVKVDAWVIAPRKLEDAIRKIQESSSPNLKAHYTDWPEFEFTLYHNKLYEKKKQTRPHIGDGCKIHNTVIMDVDGMKIVNTPNGQPLRFIHTGHVMIGDNVEIGPFTVIHRGTMGCTTISSNCTIGAKVNIGHNCFVGNNNVFAVGVIFNGGVTTGNDCWFGSGSIVKHYTSIYDDVVIGMGSVVTKDINESGIYAGNPAKFLKEKPEGWNF